MVQVGENESLNTDENVNDGDSIRRGKSRSL